MPVSQDARRNQSSDRANLTLFEQSSTSTTSQEAKSNLSLCVCVFVCVCVCMCVCVREREKEFKREREVLCVCVCVCESIERERCPGPFFVSSYVPYSLFPVGMMVDIKLTKQKMSDVYKTAFHFDLYMYKITYKHNYTY